MIHVALPIMIAGAMPYLLTLAAKAGRFSAADNHETRVWQGQLSGWRQRAHWAHLNAFEAFPLFAAAAILAHLAAPASAAVAIAAWGFVAARVAYAVCYVADLAAARSLVWFASIGCCLALFVIALRG